MKKSSLIFSCFILLGLGHPALAQTQQDNLMIGSQLANVSGTFQNKSNVFDLGITPTVAYFIRNNLALGGMLNLGMHAPKGSPTTFTYGIGPWGRYYFDGPAEFKFSQHTAFFVDGFVGLQGITHSKGGGSTNGLGIMVGPGISYFITPHISLDGIFNYNVVIGFGNATTVNKFGINIGFQVFLPTKKLRERVKERSL